MRWLPLEKFHAGNHQGRNILTRQVSEHQPSVRVGVAVATLKQRQPQTVIFSRGNPPADLSNLSQSHTAIIPPEA